LRWARRRRAREESQGCLRAVSDRSAQDERRCCVRQKRVVPAPVAGVKLAEARRIQPGSIGRQSGSDGGKRNSSPGRARHKPSNHCAGKAGCSPLDLYARVRTSSCTLHTRPRVQRAPGLPCALSFVRDMMNRTRTEHVARTRTCIRPAKYVRPSPPEEAASRPSRRARPPAGPSSFETALRAPSG